MERARLLERRYDYTSSGPINRGVEIDSALADSKNSVILEQVTNGIAVRIRFFIFVRPVLIHSEKSISKNGHVVDPANKINEVKDIWIEDSKFKHEKHTDDLDEYETIDLSGKYILPSELVDLRCHVRNVTGGGEENIKSISKVASSRIHDPGYA